MAEGGGSEVPDDRPVNVYVEIGTPTISVDWLVNCSPMASGINLTLGSRRVSPDAKGKLEVQIPITVRLHLDLNMAKIIRENLDDQIRLLSAPPDTKPN